MRLPLAFLLALLCASISFGQDLKLYAAAGVKSPVTAIAADYEKLSGTRISLVFDTAGGAEEKFYVDASATFLVTSKVRIDAAEKAGKLAGGTTIPLGDTVAGFAVTPGSAKPDISTSAKLKEALLAAPSIAFSDPARGATAGTHFLKVITALGIKDEVLKKSTLAVDGIETMRLILEGKAALGVTQLSEIAQSDMAALVGPFPPEFDLATTYSLWYRNTAPQAALDFAAFLTRPEGRARLVADGLRAPAR